jgi:rhodanese-related sulfurtransferase
LVRTYRVSTFAGLLEAEAHGRAVALDVRSEPEWATSHVRDALHLSLPDLAEIADPSRPPASVELTGETFVYCGGGFRAAVAASLLDNLGGRVTLIDQPYGAAVEDGMTVTDAASLANAGNRATRV